MSSIIIFMPCNTDLQNVEIYYFYENILYAQNVYNCKKRKRRKPLAVPELYKKCKRFPLMLFSLIFMCHLFVFFRFSSIPKESTTALRYHFGWFDNILLSSDFKLCSAHTIIA